MQKRLVFSLRQGDNPFTMRLSIVALLCLLLLPACNMKERYARNNKATTAWLETNSGKSAVNIAGPWIATSEHWGEILLEQKGPQVKGKFGEYSAEGHVNGSTVYLALRSSGWTYYTAILKKTGKSLKGYYSGYLPFSTTDQRELVLEKR